MAFTQARVESRAKALLLGVMLIAACKGGETARAGKVENPQTWAPDKLTAVEGVPAVAIEAAIHEKLAGPKLDRIDDDQWGHTKRLYRLYGNNPLWLTSDGLHETRTKALTDAILAANTDGMRLDDYPVAALANAIAANATLRIALPTRSHLMLRLFICAPPSEKEFLLRWYFTF